MSEGVNTNLCNVVLQAKLSWFAYVRRIIGFFIILIITGIISAIFIKSDVLVNTFFLGITVAYWLLVIFSIRAVKIYFDQEGIWVSSGIFPWTKGVHGVKWRDLDEAVYFTGFVSWMFRSYTIKLTHRYTKSNEIVVPDVWYGNDLVQKINEKHIELIKSFDSKEK